MKSTFTLILASLLSVFILSACETTQGAGRDVQSAGAAIEDTSRDLQD